MVGDADQLPSVGPGNILGEILRTGVVPTVRLTDIFRQQGESSIVMNAHAINAGRLPVCSPHGDFQFLEMPDEETAAEEIVRGICDESGYNVRFILKRSSNNYL